MSIAAAMPQLWLFAFKAFHRSWNVRPVRNFRDHLVQFPFLLEWEMKSKEVVIQGQVAWLVVESTQSVGFILLFNHLHHVPVCQWRTERTNSEARLPRFIFQLHNWLAEWAQASHSINSSLFFSFLICKMGTVIVVTGLLWGLYELKYEKC